MPLVFLSGVVLPARAAAGLVARDRPSGLPMTAAVDLVRPLALGALARERCARRSCSLRRGVRFATSLRWSDTEAAAQVIDNVLIVLTNCPDAEIADRIAAHAGSNKKLAACVNRMPAVDSVYRWQGAVRARGGSAVADQVDPERLPEVQEAIRGRFHRTRFRRLCAIPVVAGLPAYLRWVVDETQPPLLA